MNLSDLRNCTLKRLSMDVKNGIVSPTDIVTLLLEQIHRTNDKIHSYITVCEESALKLAEIAEAQIKAGYDAGPLHGIPVSIKDIFETKGIKTTCGSKLLKDNIPNHDGTVVKKLKSAGAIILGKTDTNEFAMGGITQARNPWNLNYIPGYSSSGSAASIAVTSAVAATGSDTGGSIREPASFCGVAGLKPTYGRVSRAGVFPLSFSLDHVGPIAKRVEDLALLLGIIAGHDEMDPTSSNNHVPDYTKRLNDDISRLRIGVPNNYFFERCDEEVRRAVEAAINRLQELGCAIVEFEFPYTREIVAAYTTINLCEASAIHRRSISERPEEYTPYVRQLFESGLFIPAVDYIQALRVRGMVLPECLRFFDKFDVMTTPTMPMVAVKVGQKVVKIDDFEESVDTAVDRYTLPFNLLGVPALSVPCGFSNDGFPIGMQIIGKPYDESTVLALGHAYEKATKWHLRYPDLS